MKEGCIYEEDFFTQLIKQLVNQLKHSEKEKERETILVIDDLDRIDPEHIFRILNVLAAHTDISVDGNKFEFDRIILVCDIQNIRKVFQNRYGSDVDFTGYIDKFYSKEVFDFNNVDGLSEKVIDLVTSVKQKYKQPDFDLSDVDNSLLKNIAYILTAMIQSNSITVRLLKRIANKKYQYPQYQLNLKGDLYKKNYKVDAVNIIDFLMWIFGDFNQLIEAIMPCKEFKTDYFHDGLKPGFCMFLLSILEYSNHQFNYSNNVFEYHSKKSKQLFKYNIKPWGEMRDRILCHITSTHEIENDEIEITDNKINYFDLLLETLEKCRDEKILAY